MGKISDHSLLWQPSRDPSLPGDLSPFPLVNFLPLAHPSLSAKFVPRFREVRTRGRSPQPARLSGGAQSHTNPGKIMAVTCISLMISDVEHVFMGSMAFCRSVLEKCLFLPFLFFLELDYLLLVLSWRSSLYILAINPLSEIWFVNIFSPTLWIAFITVDLSFQSPDWCLLQITECMEHFCNSLCVNMSSPLPMNLFLTNLFVIFSLGSFLFLSTSSNSLHWNWCELHHQMPSLVVSLKGLGFVGLCPGHPIGLEVSLILLGWFCTCRVALQQPALWGCFSPSLEGRLLWVSPDCVWFSKRSLPWPGGHR
jgi:hypothetical protein